MLVSEVMTTRVSTVSPSAPFSHIVKLLIKEKISGVPVVNKRGRVIGVISEKDLFFRLFPTEMEFYKNVDYFMNYKNIEDNAKKIKNFKAKNLMTKEVISIEPTENVLTACSLFLIHAIRRLPVIDDGKLVGIVTTDDVYRNFLMRFVKKKLR